MRTADFSFPLPPDLIAQVPAARRDLSRLLVLHRQSGSLDHRHFQDFPGYLNAGDVLVVNNSKVIPARLKGRNERTNGHFEVFLLEEFIKNQWWCMVRPGKRAPVGTRIQLLSRSGEPSPISGLVSQVNESGHRLLEWSGVPDLGAVLDEYGSIPLPPYINRPEVREEDSERYQTVYAGPPGSVAAPTAGLHFTPELLGQIQARGVSICQVTLHVGAGTFLPVKTDLVADHTMHSERFEIGPETAETIARAKHSGKKVVAVGTTVTRALEACARENQGQVCAFKGTTRIFLYPPANFHVVDALLTNFHLPESTLLMLASAFAAPGHSDHGRECMLFAYAEAVKQGYRFFSYGDAMLIL